MSPAQRPVALVTGASRGIGKACAKALADKGFDVAFTARTAKEGTGRDDSDAGGNAVIGGSLESTAADVEAAGSKALPIVADLLDYASLETAVQRTAETFGRLDVLVLNAVHTGAGSMVPLAEVTPEIFEIKLRANAIAQVVLVNAAIPHLIANGGGRIIAITSHAATHAPKAPVGKGGWGFAYAASKAAAHHIAGHLAVDHADDGVIAVNVDPGFVVTERMEANQKRLGLEGNYRGAPPSAPASAVAWLATSDDAKEFNGQTVEGLRLALTHKLHPDWR